jgi:uncharacterized protein with NAD-binding domain and iron-sulfur cluster
MSEAFSMTTRPSQPRERAKRDLLRSLVAARQAILKQARALPPSGQSVIFLGGWTARHLVAHLIGWDHTNLQAAAEIRRHKVPSFFRYHDRDWATYNAALVRRHNRGSYCNLVAAAARSSDRLIAELEQIPASEFFLDSGLRNRGWKVTIGRLLAAEANDENIHAAQLRKFRTKLLGPH